MEYWTAFILGLVGSLHCVGMCGPIAMSLPFKAKSRITMSFNIAIYNLGRVTTYAVMGAILGLAGMGVALAGFQQIISVGLGILILLSVVLTFNFRGNAFRITLVDKLLSLLKFKLSQLLSKQTGGSFYLIGLLNGFLPCGMVYIALAGALVMGSVLGGISYMVLFGLGTIPLMFIASFAGNYLGVKFRRKLNKLVPAFLVLLAIMLIFRGFSGQVL